MQVTIQLKLYTSVDIPQPNPNTIEYCKQKLDSEWISL